MTAPLKLNGTAGDLKEITTTEENYLAYLAGLQLAAADSTDVGQLTTSSGGTNIGSFTNTFFNEAVGTHDGTNITSGSTTINFYQNTGTASEASVDFHRPVRWAGSGNIEELDNTEFNEVVDRLLSTIFTNDYPGAYRLATTSPGAGWTTAIGFSDTQSFGGPSVTHLIWKRTSMTAPTAVKTVKILNDTTAFDGLKEMNDTEMQVTFGQRAKTRIMHTPGHIGSYQFRSSAQGAPTDPGTWVAKGTATDTKDTITNVAYSGSYANSFTGNYANSFTGYYTGSFTGSYTGSFTGFYASSFAGTYARGFAGTYVGAVLQYFVTYYNIAGFNNNVRLSNRYSPPYGRYVPAYYTGFYTGYFTGFYTGSFTGSYSRNFSGTYSRAFAGNYANSFTGNYANSFTGYYTGETIDATDTTIETYTLYVRAA